MTRRFALLAALSAVTLAGAALADRSTPGRRKPPAEPPAQAPPAVVAPPPTTVAPPPTTVAPPAAPTITMTPGPVAPAAAAPVPSGPPGKAEVPVLVHDAGTVERGTDLVHSFQIKNVGEHPLTVDAKAGCGCTVTDYDKIVAPGQTGKLLATVHTTNFKGPISKSITVTTNDPENSRFTLQMRANVTVPLDVQPSESITFNGKTNALKPQTVTVKSSDGQAFDILGVTAADPAFTVKVAPAGEGGAAAPKPGTVASGASSYSVTVTPGEVAVGRVSSTVALRTSHPKAPELSLRLFGNVAGDVEVVPQQVQLSTGAAATEASKTQVVKIRKPEGAELEILSVTAENPLVTTSLRPVTPGREYDLEVRYVGEPTTTALATRIKAVTNDPKQPNLEIQVWGRVDPGMRAPQAPVSIAPVQAQAPPAP